MVTNANAGRRWIRFEIKGSKYVQEEDTSLKTKTASTTAPGSGVGESGEKFSVQMLWVYGVVVGNIIMKTEILVWECGNLTAVKSS